MKLHFICAFKAKLLFLWYLFLGKLLPAHIKRLLFITAIHLKLANEQIIQDATLHRLNAKMKIASDVNALKAAQAFSKRVELVIPDTALQGYISAHRGSLVIDGICPSNDISQRVADLFISRAKPWLNYGAAKMSTDIKHLLNPCSAEIGRQNATVTSAFI